LKSLRFFLLDLGEETTSQGSEIWLWGIDDDGKNVLLVDREFRPYLYATAEFGHCEHHDVGRFLGDF